LTRASADHLIPSRPLTRRCGGPGNGAHPVGDYRLRARAAEAAVQARGVRSEAPGSIRSVALPPALTCSGSLRARSRTYSSRSSPC